MNFADLPPALRRNLARLGWTAATSIQLQAWPPVLAGRDVLGLARTGSGKTAAFLLPIGERLLRSGQRSHTLNRIVTGAGRGGAGGGAGGDAGSDASGGSRFTAADRSGSGGRAVSARSRSAPAAAPPRSLRALVLCPTRELALQVAQNAEALLNGTSVVVDCMHGKVALGPQVSRLAEGVDLLVATPGRVLELIECSALDLTGLQIIVLDEADRMLDMGLGPQVNAILATAPPDRQTLLFSATMPPALAGLAEGVLRDAVVLQIDPSGSVAGHVVQLAIRVADEQKVAALMALLASEDRRADSAPPRNNPPPVERVTEPGAPDGHATPKPREGVLVFCRTRRRAHWIGEALIRHGIHVGYLHGDRSHAQRVRALEGFRAGRQRVLLATDVAARGLHVESVRTVVQYDLPVDPAEHIHRVGRAAHGLEGRGGIGEAIALVSPREQAQWEAILAMTGASPTILALPHSVSVEGATRGASPRRALRHPVRTSGQTGGRRVGASSPARADPRDQRRPSRKSKPIGKNQRPGGGVRPRAAGE